MKYLKKHGKEPKHGIQGGNNNLKCFGTKWIKLVMVCKKRLLSCALGGERHKTAPPERGLKKF